MGRLPDTPGDDIGPGLDHKRGAQPPFVVAHPLEGPDFDIPKNQGTEQHCTWDKVTCGALLLV